MEPEKENPISQPQPFIFIRDGVPEEVQPEQWQWIAFYSEKDFIKQFDEKTFTFHQFKEIDQTRLDIFVMQSLRDPRKIYALHFKPWMKLIHAYRHTVLNVGTPDEIRFKTYRFGYEESVNGRRRKTIFTIYPDDTLHMDTE
jgi:hypothetical protein